MLTAADDLSTMKRGDLIREAKRLGVKLRKYGESGMTNVWLREQILACPVAYTGRVPESDPAPEPVTRSLAGATTAVSLVSMVVRSPTLNAPPPRVSDDPDLPLLELANQVLTRMEIQPPLSEYVIEEQLHESGKSLTLELSCRVGGVSANVNPETVPERLSSKIEGLTREDFGPTKLKGLRGRINAENRALRLQLHQLQGFSDAAGNPIPFKPDLIEDPAAMKASGDGPQR